MNILSLIYSIPTDDQPPNVRMRSDSQSTSSTNSRDTQPTIIDTIAQVEYRNLQGDHHYEDLISSTQTELGVLAISNETRPDGFGGIENGRARQGSSSTRVRSSSNLPPQAPAPSAVLPSTPGVYEKNDNTLRGPPSPSRLPPAPATSSRPRGNSISHRRTGSGNRVDALREEASALSTRPPYTGNYNENNARRSRTNGNSQYADPESPPLPALPSPSEASEHSNSITPRVSTAVDLSQIFEAEQDSTSMGRPRGGTSTSDNTGLKVLPPLINDTTNMGTISQRRNKPISSSTIFEGATDTLDGLPKRLTGSSLPTSSVSSLSVGRSRASSHPVRPSNSSIVGLPLESGPRPPLQPIANSSTLQPRKTSSSFRQSPQPPSRMSQQSPFPPSSFPGPIITLIPPPPVLPGQLPITPTSPLPAQPPNDTLRKPYHLMNLLSHTMSSKSGGYITRRLHVPFEVWSQGGAKLTNLPDKIRVVEVLCDALMEVQNASVEFCGPMGAASGMGLGVGSVTRKDGEIWISKLDEFLVVCDNVVSSFGKRLSVGEGFVVKKNSVVSTYQGHRLSHYQ